MSCQAFPHLLRSPQANSGFELLECVRIDILLILSLSLSLFLSLLLTLCSKETDLSVRKLIRSPSEVISLSPKGHYNIRSLNRELHSL
jgi:hypothetical protein